MVQGPLDQDAPPFAGRHAEVVDLEGHLVLGVGYPGAEILVRGAVLDRAEHDRPLVQPVVDREHRRAEPAGERDPADAPGGDQPQALGLVQVLEHRGLSRAGLG